MSRQHPSGLSRRSHHETQQASGAQAGPKTPHHGSSGASTGLPAPKSSSRAAGGSGGMRSIGENFQVNPVNGTMSLSIPIHTTPTRANFHPQLNLNYDSGNGNGPLGVGWALTTGMVISRKTSKNIPLYSDDDVFVLSGLDDLVPTRDQRIQGNYLLQRFRPRTENFALRIERWTNIEDYRDTYWRIVSADNVTTFLGCDENSRISENDPEQRQNRIFSWLQCRSYDSLGNAIYHRYKSEDDNGESTNPTRTFMSTTRDAKTLSRQKYLKSIKYGNFAPARDLDTWTILHSTQECAFEVILDYGEHSEANPSTAEDSAWVRRADAFSTFRSGFEIRTQRLCQRILMFHHIASQLGVQDCLVSSTSLKYDSSPSQSLLIDVLQSGHVLLDDGSSTSQSLPPFHLDYTKPVDLQDLHVSMIDETKLTSVPYVGRHRTSWVDLDGEGAPGLLADLDGGSWLYRRNLSPLSGSPSWNYPETQAERPTTGKDGRYFFQDLDRRGSLDLVYANDSGKPLAYSERQRGGWNAQIPIPMLANLDENIRWIEIDLTGNGSADLLKLGNDIILWHECLDKRGFSAEQRVAREVNGPEPFSNAKTVTYCVADMCGDGLDDIVRISNDSITYWPNLGYGRFGTPIVTYNAPVLDDEAHLNSDRIKMADVTGSGTTDLLYFPRGGGINIYINEAGNGWSQAYRLDLFPELDSFSTVFVMDLLGIGNPCLCWSGVRSISGFRLYYINFLGGTKPHILREYSSSYGNRGRISYKPSTWYRLNAEQRGESWTTRLSFPVQCIDAVTHEDPITKVATTVQYEYHNGYYDGAAREFRGFERVDIRTRQESLSTNGKGFAATPSHQRLWFHTGDQGRTSMSWDKTLDAQYYSNRALRGKLFREHTYKSNSNLALGFLVSSREISYATRNLTTSINMKVPVIVVDETQVLTQHYTEGLSDVRRDVQYNYAFSDYGHATKSIHIAFGNTDSTLNNKDARQIQSRSIISMTQRVYTNAVEDLNNYRRPQVAEQRTYRLFSLLTELPDFVRKAAMMNLTTELSDDIKAFLPASSVSELADNQIEGTRTYYRSQSLTSKLPLGRLEAYSVVHQTYSLSCTPKLRAQAYQSAAQLGEYAMNDLMVQGGFIDLDGNESWWTPSDRYMFGIDNSSELRAARWHFYTPTIKIDPFDNMTTTTLDDHLKLLPIKTIDAVGNTILTEYEYAHLQPISTTDANGNTSRHWYNALGEVCGFTLPNKKQTVNLSRGQSKYIIISDTELQIFIEKPDTERALSLLGSLDSVIIGNYALPTDGTKPQHNGPLFQITIGRTSRASETEIPISILYLDGKGKPLQTVSLSERSASGKDTWLVSEQELHDYAGNIIRRQAPFYQEKSSFCPIDQITTVATFSFYDERGRPVGSLHPDHSWTKTKYSVWHSEEWDAGDTIDIDDPSKDPDIGSYLRSIEESDYLPNWMQLSRTKGTDSVIAAKKSSMYAEAPSFVHVDALGQAILSVVDDGIKQIASRTVFDKSGNPTHLYDGLERLVEQNLFDLAGNCLFTAGMDFGKRFYVYDCRGQLILMLSSRQILSRFTYDALRRSDSVWVSEKAKQAICTEKTVYGESRPNASERNLCLQVYQHFDQSGLLTNEEFDNLGNCISQTQTFAQEYRKALDWSVNSELERLSYHTTASFDLLGREILSTDANDRAMSRAYSLAGHVHQIKFRESSVTQWKDVIVSSMYTPTGKPIQIVHGNGTVTNYAYDLNTDTQVLKEIRRTTGNKAVLERKTYAYDCVGRQVLVYDDAAEEVFFRNDRITATMSYTYDCLGQLIESQGRENIDVDRPDGKHLAPYSPFGSEGLNMVGNSQQLAMYREAYTYDDAGNISSMSHSPLNNTSMVGWTRNYFYEEPSQLEQGIFGNKLSRTTVGKVEENYKYDEDAGIIGCISSIPGYSSLTWDLDENLRSTSTQRVNKGIPETVWYVYNSAGIRTRKIIDRASDGSSTPTRAKSTYYLPNVEIHQVYSGDGVTLKRETSTCEVIGTSRVALVEFKSIPSESPSTTPLYRFQASQNLELDEVGGVVSYEEYSPFGCTTFVAHRSNIEAVSKYRFAAYERDVETGLYYCQQRYYAPWLARWISSDRIFTQDGLNTYRYTSNDPINYFDPTGTMRHSGVGKSDGEKKLEKQQERFMDQIEQKRIRKKMQEMHPTKFHNPLEVITQPQRLTDAEVFQQVHKDPFKKGFTQPDMSIYPHSSLNKPLPGPQATARAIAIQTVEYSSIFAINTGFALVAVPISKRMLGLQVGQQVASALIAAQSKVTEIAITKTVDLLLKALHEERDEDIKRGFEDAGLLKILPKLNSNDPAEVKEALMAIAQHRYTTMLIEKYGESIHGKENFNKIVTSEALGGMHTLLL